MKNVYLARGVAEAVTRWTAAVTQLAGFVICRTGAKIKYPNCNFDINQT